MLEYACVHLQLYRGVWNLLEDREEMLNRVTNGKGNLTPLQARLWPGGG